MSGQTKSCLAISVVAFGDLFWPVFLKIHSSSSYKSAYVDRIWNAV
jgi:hypothetical protein